MLALRSLLPHLGLFLCLALCFSPSLSASDNGSCVIFDEVYNSNNLGINTTYVVSGENTVYTVMVPVNDSVSAVILKAEKDNSPVGTWNGIYQSCNGSSVYNLTSPNDQVFQANWTVPNSEDVTKVSLQVFIVLNRTALQSSVNVEQVNSSILTPTPASFGTSQTIIKTTTENTANTTSVSIANTTSVSTTDTTSVSTVNTTSVSTVNTTSVSTANTTSSSTAKTTARSLAIRTLSNPLAGALHILLVFLISKLLF